MWLISNTEKVSSVCNDVIGDIAGVVLGATGAAIAAQLFSESASGFWLSLTLTSLIAAVTVGGKALGKQYAVRYNEKNRLLGRQAAVRLSEIAPHSASNFTLGRFRCLSKRSIPRRPEKAVGQRAERARGRAARRADRRHIQNGGHLSSNLGVVELTVSLHFLFDSPADRILWDVGHQNYVHKLLTGRRERFGTLRQFGGLSGFPSRRKARTTRSSPATRATRSPAALGFAGRKRAGAAAATRSPSSATAASPTDDLRGAEQLRQQKPAADHRAQRQRNVHLQKRRRGEQLFFPASAPAGAISASSG